MPDSWHVWNKKIYVVYLLVPGSVVKHNNNNKSNQTDSFYSPVKEIREQAKFGAWLKGRAS